MYKIFKSRINIEGEIFETFGIKGKNGFKLPDVSDNRDTVIKLIKILNKENAEESFVIEYIEEFLAENI